MNTAIDDFTQVLRAYISEFGVKNVIAVLPLAWAGKYPERLGKLKIYYISNNTIEIHSTGGSTYKCLVADAFALSSDC